MAWDQLSVTKPHLVYIILGGFTSLFMLCSTVIKERMYIGEATVATLCGLIFGPHAANLIDPQSWGSTDIVTIEFSRIVLVVQCFAVGVELPKFYMERHWRSVVFLLVPVMTFGWLITSLFVWVLVPPLNWLESLVVAACVTATDPVLASSVVGKGKFAKRVPKHLRDVLSAESGCNDGMAFPFIYLSLYLIQYHQGAKEVTFHWLVVTVLYECVFGAVYGFLIGYFARHGIKYAERHELIDRESFLVFYFVLALFCAGSGSILGVDDLLVGFSAGVGFSNDGWFTNKTEESHVSNVIDLLLNLAYFVYLGTIIPWDQFNNTAIGLAAWKLSLLALAVIFFRRIPIMMALKPLIPDIKTWREALFAGHFGPIGVGAIFVAILARAELETGEPIPLAELPPSDHPNYTLLSLVWPIVTFLVVSSIIVHGSSVAVFTLGKHINTLTITMSYTTAHEDGPSWMNRLPRISSVSRSQARTMSDTDFDDVKMPEYPPGTLPPVGLPGHFLRRQKEDENHGHSRSASRASSLASKRRKKRWDDGIGPGGPISQSAIFPQRRSQSESMSRPPLEDPSSPLSEGQDPVPDMLSSPPNPASRGRTRESRAEREEDEEEEDEKAEMHATLGESSSPARERVVPEGVELYDEGDHVIVENEDGDVLAVEPPANEDHAKTLTAKLEEHTGRKGFTVDGLKKAFGDWRQGEIQKRKEKEKVARKHEPARAYQFGNTIIVEDEDGEVVKKYDLPVPDKEAKPEGDIFKKYMGMAGRSKGENRDNAGGPSTEEGGDGPVRPGLKPARASTWASVLSRGAGMGEASGKKVNQAELDEEDDRHIRFTIGGVGQRMTKEDFLKEMQKLDKNTRQEVVDHSSASQGVKNEANRQGPLQLQQARPTRQRALSNRGNGKSVAAPPGHTRLPSTAEEYDKEKEGEGRSPSSTGSSSSQKPSPSSSKSSPAGSRERPQQEVEPSTTTNTAKESNPTKQVDSEMPSSAVTETAAERRRRLAALMHGSSEDTSGGGKSIDDRGSDSAAAAAAAYTETPAERRRREAALGMSVPGAEEEDSDDDNTPRVLPSSGAGGRRGIRFADDTRR